MAGLAPATVANHHTYLGAFARWRDATRPHQPVTAADAATVAAFLGAEGQRGVAAGTRQAELAALRRFLAWLQLAVEVAANPAAVVETPRAAPLAPQTDTPEQVAAILAHTAGLGDLRGRQRHAIVSTLRYTGMRSQELRTLARDDLDLAGGRAWVTGKGGRRRPVLLPGPLVAVLTAFCEQVRPQLPDSPLVLANAHPFVTTPHAGFSQEARAREVELAGQGARVPGRHHPPPVAPHLRHRAGARRRLPCTSSSACWAMPTSPRPWPTPTWRWAICRPPSPVCGAERRPRGLVARRCRRFASCVDVSVAVRPVGRGRAQAGDAALEVAHQSWGGIAPASPRAWHP